MNEILISGIVALLTAIITLHCDKKRKIHEKQELLYIDIFDALTTLRVDPDCIFSDEYFSLIRKLSSQAQLFASSDVLKLFVPLYNKIQESNVSYAETFRTIEYESEKRSRLEMLGETEIVFQQEEESFAIAHRLPKEYVDETIIQISKAMRKDVGTENTFAKTITTIIKWITPKTKTCWNKFFRKEA